MNEKKTDLGQAVVEYILIFAFISLFAIYMVRSFGSFMGSSMGSLAYHLTQQLTIGVCENHCFGNDYANR